MRSLVSTLATLALLAPLAAGQSSTLDQFSPDLSAVFNRDDPGMVWQQQVRVGMDGQLEGFRLHFEGPAGAQANVRLRRGDGWTNKPKAWEGGYTKSTAGVEKPFFDVTGANLHFSAGDTFVIELNGNGTGMVVRGSYSLPAQYPEPLFLNGPGCYQDCGWRIAFRSWMYRPGDNYCRATVNSTTLAGVMVKTGSTSLSANDLTLYAVNVPDQPGYFIYGRKKQTLPLGDGFLCVGGSIVRLPVTTAKQNRLKWKLDFDNLPPGGEIYVGSRLNFQAWFRDPAAAGAGFNFSDGLMLEFVP